MKNVMIAMIGIALSLHCSLGRAAVFSSTSMLNQSFTTYLTLTSRFTNPALGVNSGQSFLTPLSSGVNTASAMVDTDLDTGFVSGMQFKPFALPASTRSHNMTLQRVVVDVPADFPIPPVTHIENDQYQARITITGLSPATPTLLSSTTGPIDLLYYRIPWFRMFNTLTFASPSFIVDGTYEAIGPTMTRSVPFSVEYQRVGGLTQLQRTGIVGGQNFNNGFQFVMANDLSVTYRAVNPVIFDEQVDDLHFRASFGANNVGVRLLKGGDVPEPGEIALAAGAAMALAAAARRRGKKGSELFN